MKKINKVIGYVVASGVLTQLLQIIAQAVEQAEFDATVTIVVMGVINLLIFFAVKGREALKS